MLFTSKQTVRIIVFSKLFSKNRRFLSNNLSKMSDNGNIALLTRQLAPPLNDKKYKGQAGRIGIFGGSFEYTGAPYFSAISSLKVGADLAHVFCKKAAAPVIKSYSPELIVHPVLDDENASDKIQPWLERLHVVLIGPGLGREPSTFTVIDKVIEMCKTLQKPLVIDADGLFYVAAKPEVLRNYPAHVVLTPNAIEFSRLVGGASVADTSSAKQQKAVNFFNLSSSGIITILCKGHEDEIFDAVNYTTVSGGGSGRRCGGQGDILAGSVSTFLAWALSQPAPPDNDNRAIVASYAACKLVRMCNERGFAKFGRSMTCSDMIPEIHGVFQEHFELNL